MSQVTVSYSVCGKCFLESPGDSRLPAEPNCRRHPNAARIDVLWDNVNLHFYRQTRPVPDKWIRGRFVLCTFESQCKGERCTFAHSVAEQKQWNKLKDGGKHEDIG